MSEKQKTRKPDIGGQAVMEGVMMRSPDAMAIAVRRPDDSIVVKYTPYEPVSKKHPWMGVPFIRGAVNMLTMLTAGMSTLQASIDMLGIMDEEPTKFEKWLSEKLGKGIDKVVMAVAVVLALIMSVGLFVAIPSGLEQLLRSISTPAWLVTLAGGVLRIAILVVYMILCAKVPDVKRTFQYHGAEHKTVYCNEHELPLTPENAQQFTTLHPRCGTAFLLIVFLISILLGIVLNTGAIPNYFLRLVCKLALIPVVAGISYEVLKGLAHSESKFACTMRWPGLQMQRLTTRQPDDKQLECAIVAMNVALHGLPAHAEKTPEGYAILHSYAESDPAYVPPVPEVRENTEE